MKIEKKTNVRIAVAKDKAFCFYYKDSFETSVSSGIYPYVSRVGYSGYNPTLSINTEETLSPLGLGMMTTPVDSGELLEAVSTSSSDIGNIVIVQVLDEEGLERNCMAVLSGTTPVPLLDIKTNQPVPISRVNAVVNRGSTATTGDVLIRQQGDGTVFSGFKAEDQRSFNLLFTIPSNKKGLFLPSESSINRSAGSDSYAIIRVKSRIKDGLWLNSSRWGLQQKGTSAFLFETYDRPLLPPFTDIMVTAQSSVSGVDVTGRIPIQLVSKTFGNN